jgi:hypothetical protein
LSLLPYPQRISKGLPFPALPLISTAALLARAITITMRTIARTASAATAISTTGARTSTAAPSSPVSTLCSASKIAWHN